MSAEGRKAIIARQTGSNLRTGAFVRPTDVSGGVTLSTSSYTPLGIVIKNTSHVGAAVGASGTVHVGSSGNPPYASGGYVLIPGEREIFPVDNPEFVRVFSRISGTGVTWYGVDF